MAEYFSHDYDAREDGKVIDLMGEHGWAGYGLFWGLVELLYKNNGKMRTQYKRIAFALNSHPDTIKDIIENYDLFQIKKDFFSSKSVNDRLKKRKAKSEVASANAHKRWEKRNANALQTKCERNAIKESKVKDSKEEEIINKIYDVYPAKCHSGRSTGKTSKNKEKIKKLLSDHSPDDLIELIHLYISDCRRTNTYIKNFGTFLNNLPEKPDLVSAPTKPILSA